MPFYDVYGDRRAQEIVEDTWGHLRPDKEATYHGWIVLAIGCYGDTIIVDWSFGSLMPSPWQLEHFWANIYTWQDEEKPKVGVYKFTGTYKVPHLSGEWNEHPIC
jgi:hypothetical protein